MSDSVVDFFSSWQVYRAVIENDCMEHRAIYANVHEILAERGRPFSVLDLGCGDAAGTGPAMSATLARRYVGVDSAAPALDCAARILAGVDVHADLRVMDMKEMVTTSDETFDVVVACFALHHFQADEKREFMSAVRDLLAPGGELLLIDVVRRDGETREEYLSRFHDHVQTWPLSQPILDRIHDHYRESDFPEEISTQPRWATELGFTGVTQFYSGGNDTQAAWRLGA